VPVLGLASPVQAASLPNYRFTRTFGDNASPSTSDSVSVTTDSTGNVYVAGWWNGTEVFDGSGSSDVRTSAHDNYFLTKYNASGRYVWTKTFDTSAANSSAYGMGVAVDSTGNVYVTGQWQGTVRFDGVGGTDSKTTTADFNTFLTKYSANGVYDYTKVFYAASGSGSNGNSVATDGNGNIYLGSYWKGAVVFDGPSGTDSKTNPNNDSAVTKYNADGSYGWTRVMDSSTAGAQAEGTSQVAVDASGSIYAAGGWQGLVKFDGLGGSVIGTSANNSSYLVKYNSSGTYVSVKTFDTSAGSTFPTSLALDATGNVYTGGDWSGTVVFDGTGGTHSKTTPNGNAYLTKYNADGSYGWTKDFDVTGGSANGDGLATDAAGHVYLGAEFAGTVVLDGVGGSASHTTSGAEDASIVQYNSDGTYNWGRTVNSTSGGYSGQYAIAVASDSLGNVFLASDFKGTANFDGSTGGNDSMTTPDDTFFLTSYQAFIPSVNAAVVRSSPGSPDTAYGSPNRSMPKIPTLVIGGSITLTTGLALLYYHKRRLSLYS
jgi:hypothetical protein